MKILVVHNIYRIKGGEDVVASQEADLLSGSGTEVVRYFRSSGEISGPFGALRVALHMAGSAKEGARFRALLEATRPDLVHVHNFFPLITPAVFQVCREAGIPVVFTLHNFRLFCANGLLMREGRSCEDCLQAGSSWPGVRHGCYRGSSLLTLPVSRMIEAARPPSGWAANVDAFICSTEFARGRFRQYGLPGERLHLKRNFAPDLGRVLERREGNFALYLGRLSEEKGIRTLLRAWRGEKDRLVFVGSGPLEREVRSAGHPVHPGLPQKDAFRYLASCRFLVMPSECYESGIPLVLVEAMSLRVPIISSRFGAAEEVFRSDENALLFKPGDRKELRRALERGIKEESSRRKWADAARQLYEREFYPQNNLQRLLEIYRHAIAKRASGGQPNE